LFENEQHPYHYSTRTWRRQKELSGDKARKIAVSPTNIGNNRKIELKKIFEGFKTFFTHTFYRSLVISDQTASMYLSSSTSLSGLVR